MRGNNSRGLTLIETVIALSLVVVLAAAFAGAMTTGLKTENQMENRKEAVNFASEIIESLKVRTRDNKNMLSEIIKDVDNAYPENNGQIQISDINGDFSNQLNFYTSEIKYQKENGTNGLYLLTVEIEWTANGDSYNEKISTLLAVDLDD